MSENEPTIKMLENISVDCVIFGYEADELKVLVREETLQYGGEDYVAWKLPGNHVRRDEKIGDTASRILQEQTGLKNIYMKQFQVFSDPDRLKRRERDYEWIKPRLADERVLTVGFYSLVNIRDVDNSTLINVARWTNINDIHELMFDHKEILDEAIKKLRYDLLHEPLVFELLPKKFTLTQMQKIYEAIFCTTYDKRNYRKRISKMPYLVHLNETQTGVSHKPAQLYMFDREIYESSRTERFEFRV